MQSTPPPNRCNANDRNPNRTQVLMALQSNPRFLPELFQTLRGTPPGDAAWPDQVRACVCACVCMHVRDAARHAARRRNVTAPGRHLCVFACVCVCACVRVCVRVRCQRQSTPRQERATHHD